KPRPLAACCRTPTWSPSRSALSASCARTAPSSSARWPASRRCISTGTPRRRGRCSEIRAGPPYSTVVAAEGPPCLYRHGGTRKQLAHALLVRPPEPFSTIGAVSAADYFAGHFASSVEGPPGSSKTRHDCRLSTKPRELRIPG